MAFVGHDHVMLYVIGCPGSGKGTLCHRLQDELGWGHISVGDEIRAFVAEDPERDSFMAECLAASTLVPQNRLGPIINRRMEAMQRMGTRSFIIDGFPRHFDQLEDVQAQIGFPDLVIFMDCPKDLAKERVLRRHVPGRSDNEASFELRHLEFCLNSPEIIDHLKEKNLIERIDTSHETNTSYTALIAALMRAGLISTTVPSVPHWYQSYNANTIQFPGQPQPMEVDRWGESDGSGSSGH